MPAFVGDSMNAIDQRTQSGQGVIGECLRGEGVAQFSPRGVVAHLQEGEGEDKCFGVDRRASAFWGEWMELAEALDKAQEGAGGQGGEGGLGDGTAFGAVAFHRV